MLNRMRRAEPRPPASPSGRGSTISAPVLIVVGASLVLAFPVLRFGLPFGHDAVEHLWWYRCFAMQLWSGELYPRWLLEMNSGLGSPTLFVYGPLPYYAAAVFRVFTLSPGREAQELGISIWIALGLSGVTAHLWLKDVVGGRLAPTIAAILYMAAPYHLQTDLYTRTALAEFWAFAWMPLIMYYTRRVANQGMISAICGLAVSYALLITTHLFTTLMFSALPVIYAVFSAPPHRRLPALRKTVLGLLLGMALSAVYLMPALAYANYISPYKLIQSRPDYLFDRNFLFSSEMASSHFIRTLSWLTAWTGAVTAGFFMIVVLSRRKTLRREGTFWVAVAAASLGMMLPVSGWLWKMLPLLQTIQFPFRLNTIVVLSTTVLAALAIEGLRGGWELGKTSFAVCTFLLVVGWILPISRSMGYQHGWVANNDVSFDYLITSWAQWTDPALLTFSGLPQIAQQGGDARVLLDNGSAIVERWEPRLIQLHVTSHSDSWATVKQFYFPGWTATLAGGQPLSIRPSSPEGLIKVWVPAGENEIRLRMAHGPAEILGAAISGIGALTIILLTRHRSRRRGRLAPGFEPPKG